MTGRLLPVVATLAFLAGIVLIWQSERPSPVRHWFDLLPIGEPFPSLRLADGDGNSTDLEEVLTGKWSLVFFSGSPTSLDTTYPELLADHFGSEFQFLVVAPKSSVPRRRGLRAICPEIVSRMGC